jgi:hypothetical protein
MSSKQSFSIQLMHQINTLARVLILDAKGKHFGHLFVFLGAYQFILGS